MHAKRRMVWLGMTGLLSIVGLALVLDRSEVRAEGKADPGVEAARREVRMLDDLYKTAVVLITETYVHADTDVSAGTAAKKIFEAMKAKGWHEARLIDLTGKPIEEENLPRDGFEKQAVKRLAKGELFVDAVVTVDGKRYLQAATPIPVVSERCILCHEHYRQAKEKNELIGALGYLVPIDR